MGKMENEEFEEQTEFVNNLDIHAERGISQEEIEKITDDQKIKDTMLEEESKRLMQEWEAHMSDFVPEDVSTIVLEPRSEAVCLFV